MVNTKHIIILNNPTKQEIVTAFSKISYLIMVLKIAPRGYRELVQRMIRIRLFGDLVLFPERVYDQCLTVHPKVSFLSFVLFFSSLKDPCSIISEFCLSRYSFDVCYSLYICVCVYIYITHTVTIHILDVADIHIALYTSAPSKNINNFLVFFIISGYLMNLNYNL